METMTVNSSIDIEKLIRDYLPTVVHMSLGTCLDGKPWVCEVHFAYDDTLNFYFRSLTSRRHSQEITKNSHVAGNIVRQHQLGEYPLGIYFEGTAAMLASAKEQAQAFPFFKDRLGVDEAILADASQPDGHQFYKITVQTFYVFGNLEGEGGKKYELIWNGGGKR